eukprot:936675-Pelagomonas_calceolata.AAC.4
MGHPNPRGTHHLSQALPWVLLILHSLHSPKPAPSHAAQCMGVVQQCTCCYTAWWAVLKCAVSPAGCLVLDTLHMVSQIDVGRLQVGFDGDDFEGAFSGDGSDVGDDDDDEDMPGGVLQWLEGACMEIDGSDNVGDASTFPEPDNEAEMLSDMKLLSG